MLHSLVNLIGHRIETTDHATEQVKDVCFDDLRWTVRYLMLDTRRWSPGRKILLSPHVIEQPPWPEKRIPASVSRPQIESSPAVDDEVPVLREQELALARHYGWQPWWFAEPGSFDPDQARDGERPDEVGGHEDGQLVCVTDIVGYRVYGTDDVAGHVDDLIVETRTWTIDYLVIDTRVWLPGKKVLISPSWIECARRSDRRFDADLNRRQIRAGPAYDPGAPVNRELEVRMYDYLGRLKAWPDR